MTVREAFPNETIFKSASTNNLMNFLDLPNDVKVHLAQKFTDRNGKLNAYELSQYVKQMRLKPDEWNIKLLEARHTKKGVIKLLTKVKIQFDYVDDLICFQLPEYGFPTKKAQEAQVDWSLISDNKEHLLNPDGAWGEVTLCYDCGMIQMTNFEPLCPYTYNVDKYREGRKKFTTEEWIDVLIDGLNFNSAAMTEEQKLTTLQRFLGLVEKRFNTVEISIKGSGKSYCYSQISPYSWLTSGTVSRATAFYNNTTKKVGYFGSADNVVWDEVQTLKFQNSDEMNGVLKPYLESGEIRIGSYCGVADAGLTLVGNAPNSILDPTKYNMFKTLNKTFQESAMLDRFHLLIDGVKIGRFTEDRKMEGWALSSEYLAEIFHCLRSEFYYQQIVEDLIDVEAGGDTRNLNAIKKTATALLKLLFPHATCAADIDKEEFEYYCLKPAIHGRQLVLNQLRFLDKEYDNVKMPVVKVKEEA